MNVHEFVDSKAEREFLGRRYSQKGITPTTFQNDVLSELKL